MGAFAKSAKEMHQACKCWDLDSVCSVVASSPCCAFVTDSHGKYVCTNQQYDELFWLQAISPGECQSTVLHASITFAAQRTDELLLNGLRAIEYLQEVQVIDGSAYLMRTTKFPIQQAPGHIAGITMTVKRLARISKPFVDLAQLAKHFLGLGYEYQLVAKNLIQGASPTEIANELAVGLRTVNNRKKRLLEQMQVTNAVQLGGLLTRMQDAGYVDLGI